MTRLLSTGLATASLLPVAAYITALGPFARRRATTKRSSARTTGAASASTRRAAWIRRRGRSIRRTDVKCRNAPTPCQKRSDRQHLLEMPSTRYVRRCIGVSVACLMALLLFGTPSAPLADMALTTTGDAFADHHDGLPPDGDMDGFPDATDPCPDLHDSLTGCPPHREPEEEAPVDAPFDPEAVLVPHCGNGSSAAYCTCDRGESKVYSESRGFYCEGPPRCGTGSGNSDCWCDSGEDRRLGSDGLYYCQDPTADGQSCFYLNPRGQVTHSGVYVEGVCVVDPPTCEQLAVAVVAAGIATSVLSFLNVRV